MAGAALSEGGLPSFLDPVQKIAMVSTIDVGRTAAVLLCEDWTGRRMVEIAGPQDWSAGDVAAAFAQALGRPVVPALVPPERRAALLAEEGVPGAVASALIDMYDGIAKGLFLHEAGTEHRRGTIPLSTAVERIVARLPAAFRGANPSGSQ
ncbi:nmrA family domain protein (plasmid) [Sinorhizobium sp. RAC02]|nr:nmrA family domain protein [Sinorhizobium sp. RAC02]